jgi:hypothetical protein
LALFGADKTTSSLNTHRHACFEKAVAKTPMHTRLQLSALPPTSTFAREHSLRTYHQVQDWLDNHLSPCEWGWKLHNNELHPVLTKQPPAPAKLLNLISCNCKTGCERSCGCKKAGLKCSVLCGHCRGSGCNNAQASDFQEFDLDEVSGDNNEH